MTTTDIDTADIDTDDTADMSLEEHELIEARRALASARAKHFGTARLGHDDRYAMPLDAAERRLAEAQKAFDAK